MIGNNDPKMPVNNNKPMAHNFFTVIGRCGLYLTVFLTGASVMVIELLGTRLIAPFYGASLYVWSSLISVTMIALAAGYFAGGRWADRTRRTGLSLIIAVAAHAYFGHKPSGRSIIGDARYEILHLHRPYSEHYRHFLVEWLGADLLVR